MNIVMLSSEAVPLAKTGGLGDVVTSLSLELKKQNHSVVIFLPHYSWITDFENKDMQIEFMHGFKNEKYSLNSTNISGVDVYLLKQDEHFDKTGIYADEKHNAYFNNIQRFSSFTRAVLLFMMKMKMKTDVIHIHDWAAGLAAVYMKHLYNDYFSGTKSVLTIHNIGYQGISGMSEIHMTHLKKYMLPESDSINFLETAIQTCDRITTVSPTYSKEIQTKEYGHGLDKILRLRKKDLFGILNGADYSHWNPETDEFIPATYNTESIKNKEISKKELQKQSGFDINPSIPIIGMVTRLVKQKGIETLFSAQGGIIKSLVEKEKVQFVVLGTGEQWCEEQLTALSDKYPNFHAFIEFSNPLSHLIEAGSDLFLMPSVYEPCGLNQIYSLKYGTLPVVRHTGGLADTIIDEKAGKEGCGFSFKKMSGQEILKTIKRALKIYNENRPRFKEMQITGMKKEFTWKKSVHEYAAVYKSIL